MQVNPNPELHYDFLTRLVLQSGFSWALLGICLVLYIVLWRRKEKAYPVETMLLVRKLVLVGTGVVLVGLAALIFLNTGGFLPQWAAQKLSAVSYFTWDDTWGNGRGRIWSFAVKIFQEENLFHKLLGVGPDCLSSYVAAYYSQEEELLWGQKVLTNVHNEWFNILINGGILGLVSYAGIFMTSIRRFLQKDHRDVLLTGIAAAAVSYMAYNFFCYQQICCTPFMFMLMGIGEYLYQDKRILEK